MAVWTLCLSFFLLFALDASEAAPLDGTSNGTCTLVRQETCESGWSAYEGRCFRFFNHTRSWIDAEKECLGYGGNLASVHSYEEHNFIQDLIKSQTQAATSAWMGGYTPVWMRLGAEREEKQVNIQNWSLFWQQQPRSWLWSDGSNMNIEIWAPGEPNRFIEKENCFMINYQTLSNWNDYPCYGKLAFVCVKK